MKLLSCPLGHAYTSRRADAPCPYCSHRLLLPGFNDLATMAPQIAQELVGDPTAVLAHSTQKQLWRDELGHEWEALPRSRVARGDGCPYCGNRRLLRGFNDLATRHPELLATWDTAKNGPMEQVLGGARKYWWLCGKGHSYERNYYKELGGACPLCSRRKRAMGATDFRSQTPAALLREYSPRNALPPELHEANSTEVVLWVCPTHGHDWSTSLRKRMTRKTRCKVCMNRELLVGFNDLVSAHPALALQYARDLNSAAPETIMSGSASKYWWRCERGHTWEAQLSLRVSQGTGCPRCRESRLEQGVAEFLEGLGEVTRGDRSVLGGEEIDCLLPGAGVGVEVNGVFWHSDRWVRKSKGMSAEAYHRRKYETARRAGVRLLFVWEDDWAERREEVTEALRRAVANASDIDPILHIMSKG